MNAFLDQLNAASPEQALALLDGLYENSPWVAEQALPQRPFGSLAGLKYGLADVVKQAGAALQLALLRAHPELAGKAMLTGSLSEASQGEQSVSGLTHCSADELASLQRLNAAYNSRFGWPFILAVRGPRGSGLTRAEVIAAFERRLQNPPGFEQAECLRQVHRIAELRLNERAAATPQQGNQVWDRAEALARHSDVSGQLTVTYLTPAHQACAAQLQAWMRDDGFDEVQLDAVGNVVGIYHAAGGADSPRLLTGSHYDSVRNGGKYDGRLGILVPMACVAELRRRGQRLSCGIEVVGFAEEEGQRYQATFLGSSALAGQFDPAWLAQRDADGIGMAEAMAQAGLDPAAIPGLRRDPARYLGFVEVHIEQGPILDEIDLPLGIVSSISGSVRYLGELVGQASHAGTTPMSRRRDAAAGAAELLLYVEQRAGQQDAVVGTVGVLGVPDGSINVVPGRCRFSLDLRAATDERRDELDKDVLARLDRIARERGLQVSLAQTVRVPAAPCDRDLIRRWEEAVHALGLPLFHLPSGAGHDAMKLHEVMPQAMLFVRGGNAGISHNPLETISSDDAQLAVDAFGRLLQGLT